MSYSMDPAAAYVYDISGYSLSGTMQFGSNGDTSGDPTYIIGDDQGEENWCFNTWDSNLNDGFNSGSVPVEFVGATNGVESLGVGSQSAISYNGDGFTSIGEVQIEAAVSIPAEAQWSDITVKFYQGTTLEQTECVSAGPHVNTSSTPSSPAASQVLAVFPSFPNNDSVVVTGTIHMSAPAGTVPSSTSVFCGVYVSAA